MVITLKRNGLAGDALRRLLFSNNIPLCFGILAGVFASFGLMAVLMHTGIEWVHSGWVILPWVAVNMLAMIFGFLVAAVEPPPNNRRRK